MTFYSDISHFYDEIFPTDPNELAFIKKRLEGCKEVLDIGCGNGNKTALLASKGRKIIAIDGDRGMIAEAQKKYAAPGIEYRVLDMSKAASTFTPASFDAVICMGNTLVHLTRYDAIAALVDGMGSLLKHGGMALIQILNYDRILDRQNFGLPSLENVNIRFDRRYELDSCEMRFVTNLMVKHTGQEIRNEIPLYPLRRQELNTMLGEAGFSQVEHYGSYQGAPLADDSFVLIAVAKKSVQVLLPG